MKALCFGEHGDLSVLRYEDVASPEPGPDEVLVRVRATTLNHLDDVVDNVGQATLPQSLRAVARGGWTVIVGNTAGPHASIDTRYGFGKQISRIGSTMGNHENSRDVTDLLWAGRLKPVVHQLMHLSERERGSEVLESGEKFGKIVLTV